MVQINLLHNYALITCNYTRKRQLKRDTESSCGGNSNYFNLRFSRKIAQQLITHLTLLAATELQSRKECLISYIPRESFSNPELRSLILAYCRILFLNSLTPLFPRCRHIESFIKKNQTHLAISWKILDTEAGNGCFFPPRGAFKRSNEFLKSTSTVMV